MKAAHSLRRRWLAVSGWGLLFGLWLLPAARVDGVIFLLTADPAYNTTPPGGTLANSGWQYHGFWGPFSGTAVGPRHFLTAAHVGGSVGDIFSFQGREHRTIAFYDDPQSDLRLWKVCGQFPQFARLYDRPDEVGKSFVVFGRGTQRGAPVTGDNGEIKGWQWGLRDGLERWGENTVQSIILDGSLFTDLSGPLGNFLQARFDRGQGPNEAHLSAGDSGGGLFIQDGAAWKLAGVNVAVDGPYNKVPSGPGFDAAIFDEGGLYKGGEGEWTLVLDLPVDRPGGLYATRISSNLQWLRSVLDAPSATASDVEVQAASAVTGPFAPHPAEVDGSSRTIRVPLSSGTEFFRLRGCCVQRITSVARAGEALLIRFEEEQGINKVENQ